jgi:hypothetical protein
MRDLIDMALPKVNISRIDNALLTRLRPYIDSVLPKWRKERHEYVELKWSTSSNEQLELKRQMPYVLTPIKPTLAFDLQDILEPIYILSNIERRDAHIDTPKQEQIEEAMPKDLSDTLLDDVVELHNDKSRDSRARLPKEWQVPVLE